MAKVGENPGRAPKFQARLKSKTKRWVDPIVAELRRIREAHAKKFNYDLSAIFRDFEEYERALKEKFSER